jgi:NAD+ diphosphatase
VYYSGLALDRASGRRTDPGWVSGLLADPGSRVIPLWRDQCLVREGSPVVAQAGAARVILAAAKPPVLLGLDGGTAAFAADLSALDEQAALALAGADAARDVRQLVAALTPAQAGLLAYARGMLHWHRNQRYCGACGGQTHVRDGGHLRVCGGCGKQLFPRIEPAIIVLVELPGTPARCLMGRHHGSPPGRFSTLAGFVEIGESLEDAVRREVAEEAGVTVGEVSYQGSQAWPFPSGIMIGFRALAVSDRIGADGAELLEARWFTAAELRDWVSAAGGTQIFRLDSIGRILIEGWLADNQ